MNKKRHHISVANYLPDEDAVIECRVASFDSYDAADMVFSILADAGAPVYFYFDDGFSPEEIAVTQAYKNEYKKVKNRD